ncbi:MAG: hypothetical protein HKM98_10965 [Gammaproteobacteria bacterium]|nr:hypothetical protein [Gammaproteobacteria bacterium]
MAMSYQWHDMLGTLGVAMIVMAYFLLQIGRVSGRSPWYSAVNAVGAALVLLSLYYEFNLAAALVESFWLVISIAGLVLALRRRLRNH